jgi:hypothetical protein
LQAFACGERKGNEYGGIEMNKFLGALLLTAGIIATQPAAAQSQCDILARDGIMQRKEWHTSNYAKLVLLSRLTQMSDADGTETLSHSGQVGYGPISIGPGTWNKEKRDTLKTQLEKLVNIDEVLASQSSLLLSSGDPIVTKAISDCLRNGGLAVTLLSSGPDLAIMDIEWTPFSGPGSNADAIVDEFKVFNGSIVGGANFTRHNAALGIRNRRSITFSRTLGKDLTVVVNTNAGSSHSYLPPVASGTPQPLPPPVAEVKINRISVPFDSSDDTSWPRNQMVWTVTFPIRNLIR